MVMHTPTSYRMEVLGVTHKRSMSKLLPICGMSTTCAERIHVQHGILPSCVVYALVSPNGVYALTTIPQDGFCDASVAQQREAWIAEPSGSAGNRATYPKHHGRVAGKGSRSATSPGRHAV